MPKDISEGFDRLIQNKDSRYFTEETVPANTSTVGAVLNTGEGGVLGQNKIVTVAATAVALADTKVLTVTYEDSGDGTTDWQALGVYSYTASGAATFGAGSRISPDFTIPDQARAYTRVTIATDDLAATGTVDSLNSRQP